jgi:hypothetical protein
MEFNSLIFPIPKASYNKDDYKGELIWIPRKEVFTYRDKLKYTNYKSFIRGNLERRPSLQLNKNTYVQKIPIISFSIENKFKDDNNKIDHIPCLYLRMTEHKSNKIIIYFHANYEDLGQTRLIASSIQKYLKLNVLCMEYPGYGIYKSLEKSSCERVIKDAEIIYNFLTNVMSIAEDNIIIMGRCIGSGPATYLASKYKPFSLCLISPIVSIRGAVNSLFNKLKMGWLAEKLIKERYIILTQI